MAHGGRHFGQQGVDIVHLHGHRGLEDLFFRNVAAPTQSALQLFLQRAGRLQPHHCHALALMEQLLHVIAEVLFHIEQLVVR